jgi:hypothetical protein
VQSGRDEGDYKLVAIDKRHGYSVLNVQETKGPKLSSEVIDGGLKRGIGYRV